MPSSPAWTIAPLSPRDLPGVSRFNAAARKELFPDLALTPDISLTVPNALFVVARARAAPTPAYNYRNGDNEDADASPPLSPASDPGSDASVSTSSLALDDPAIAAAAAEEEYKNTPIIGVIGLIPFNPRFPSLPALPTRTGEVVRLYVSKPYRRLGLARALFSALEARARDAGWESLYLHTHPWLPGAVRFWGKMGFQTLLVEREGWCSIHMALGLEWEVREGREVGFKRGAAAEASEECGGVAPCRCAVAAGRAVEGKA